MVVTILAVHLRWFTPSGVTLRRKASRLRPIARNGARSCTALQARTAHKFINPQDHHLPYSLSQSIHHLNGDNSIALDEACSHIGTDITAYEISDADI